MTKTQFWLFLLISQIFASCGSYVILDFVQREPIKKLPDEIHLKVATTEEKKSTPSEDLTSFVLEEEKFENEIYENENAKTTCEEEINLIASNNPQQQFLKYRLGTSKKFSLAKIPQTELENQGAKRKKENKKIKIFNIPPVLLWIIGLFLIGCFYLLQILVMNFLDELYFHILSLFVFTGDPLVDSFLGILILSAVILFVMVVLFLLL